MGRRPRGGLRCVAAVVVVVFMQVLPATSAPAPAGQEPITPSPFGGQGNQGGLDYGDFEGGGGGAVFNGLEANRASSGALFSKGVGAEVVAFQSPHQFTFNGYHGYGKNGFNGGYGNNRGYGNNGFNGYNQGYSNNGYNGYNRGYGNNGGQRGFRNSGCQFGC
ncbi:N66 matrix protein-like [Eriocheir sinensis]|uniref:N66 matrix protein-like n=1 Tax=Eriocheir sinensis TaxID=95602 RepID=UPI0021C99216|nr:N66 matrix protein-like [Eriocheir sinensis]XP_050720507.1 N66 matrix protein-like [Eriocheir sinensis]